MSVPLHVFVASLERMGNLYFGINIGKVVIKQPAAETFQPYGMLAAGGIVISRLLDCISIHQPVCVSCAGVCWLCSLNGQQVCASLAMWIDSEPYGYCSHKGCTVSGPLIAYQASTGRVTGSKDASRGVPGG